MSHIYPADFASAAQQIVNAGQFLNSQGLAPATSGNYSMRLADGTLALTVSGRHKGRLVANDVMQATPDGAALDGKKPSAETALHAQLYKLYPQANAVLHAHSTSGVILTRLRKGDTITLAGYEMLKAFPGITTHETSLSIPVVDNAQDMDVLMAAIAPRLTLGLPAYLIRDHGFYVWAPTMPQAEYMSEALEHLLKCEVELEKISPRSAA